MLIGTTTVTGHLIIVPIVLGISGRNSWMVILISLLPSILMGYVFSELFKIGQNSSLVELLLKTLGKPFGYISIIYSLYFLLPVIINIRALMDFMTTAIMPETPSIIFGLIFLSICTYAVTSGLENIMRAYEFLMPLLIFSGIMASIISFPYKNFELLLPILEHGINPILKATIPLIGLLGELVVITMIAPFLNKSSNILMNTIVSILFTGLLFMGPMTGPVTIFGEELATKYVYPTFSQISYIKVGFEENLQPLAIFLWIAGSLGKISIFYYATVLCTAQTLGLSNHKPIILPIGIIALVASIMFFSNTHDIRSFVENYYSLLSITLGIIFPVIFLITLKTKYYFNLK